MRYASRSFASRFFALLLCGSVLALPACDSGSEDEPGIEGTWRAEVDGAAVGEAGTSGTFTMDLLEDEGGQVSGDGELAVEDPNSGTTVSVDFNVDGTIDAREVSLEWVLQANGNAVQFEGTLSEDSDQIDGAVVDPNGAEEVPVQFERQ